jgi:hypothetical protein
MMASGKAVEVVRIKITGAGRRAIEEWTPAPTAERVCAVPLGSAAV